MMPVIPEQIGVARDLLAHSDLRPTTKYDNRAKGLEASRSHGRVIAVYDDNPGLLRIERVDRNSGNDRLWNPSSLSGAEPNVTPAASDLPLIQRVTPELGSTGDIGPAC